MNQHPTSLTLRRLRVGEAVGEGPKVHVAGCEACTAAMRGFDEEQRAFEQQVSFERFTASVSSRVAPPQRRRSRVVAIGFALAATLALVFAVTRVADTSGNRIKGGASVEFVVAGTTGQRQVTNGTEPLATGERVRLGLTAGTWPYAIVVSVDDRGTLTPVYVENGRSLGIAGTTWLPDSLEFTGQGAERIVVIVSASPLTIETVSRAVKTAYEAAHGEVTHMIDLDLPGEQFQRTFLKP